MHFLMHSTYYELNHQNRHTFIMADDKKAKQTEAETETPEGEGSSGSKKKLIIVL